MNINISSKSDYAAPWTYFLLLGLFCSIYRKYTNVFTFFREGLKFWNYNILSFSVRGILRTFSNILDGAFCWKSFCKFILFSSQIGFDIALTDIEATLKQRWNGVVQRWKTVSSKLCKGDLTLLQCWTSMLYQFCATLKIWLRILFHFQRRVNVISMVIHNVETTSDVEMLAG